MVRVMDVHSTLFNQDFANATRSYAFFGSRLEIRRRDISANNQRANLRMEEFG